MKELLRKHTLGIKFMRQIKSDHRDYNHPLFFIINIKEFQLFSRGSPSALLIRKTFPLSAICEAIIIAPAVKSEKSSRWRRIFSRKKGIAEAEIPLSFVPHVDDTGCSWRLLLLLRPNYVRLLFLVFNTSTFYSSPSSLRLFFLILFYFPKLSYDGGRRMRFAHLLPTIIIIIIICFPWYYPLGMPLPSPLFVIRNLMYNKPLVQKESYSLWSAASLNISSFKEPLLQLLEENALFSEKETQPQTRWVNISLKRFECTTIEEKKRTKYSST